MACALYRDAEAWQICPLLILKVEYYVGVRQGIEDLRERNLDGAIPVPCIDE